MMVEDNVVYGLEDEMVFMYGLRSYIQSHCNPSIQVATSSLSFTLTRDTKGYVTSLHDCIAENNVLQHCAIGTVSSVSVFYLDG